MKYVQQVSATLLSSAPHEYEFGQVEIYCPISYSWGIHLGDIGCMSRNDKSLLVPAHAAYGTLGVALEG